MSFLETLKEAPVCTLRRECFSPPRGPPCSLTCSHSARGSQVQRCCLRANGRCTDTPGSGARRRKPCAPSRSISLFASWCTRSGGVPGTGRPHLSTTSRTHREHLHLVRETAGKSQSVWNRSECWPQARGGCRRGSQPEPLASAVFFRNMQDVRILQPR